MKKKVYLIIAYILTHVAFVAAQTVVTDADLVGGETYNWTSDTEYILDGNVYLEEGGVLNIEAGTVIKGRTVASNGIDISSSLIISRGAQIFAEGTAENPIIFTAEADDLSLTDDLTSTDNELWGGILILGRAPIGEDVPTGLDFAEDVIEGIPSEETRAFYGGTDAGDNSGVMRYVSIRHGGAILSGDNEIQGLSLGGVGNGTTLEYIEIFANLDDGIEIFGGTVNLKNVVVSFQGDDAIDVDESWDGFIQYALTLQQNIDPEIGDNAVEYDGSANEATDVEGTRTVGRIYNATFIGSGSEGSSNGLRMKEDGAAQFWNSIWTQFSGSVFRFQNTSVDRLDAGETVLANNIVWDYGQLYNDGGYSVEFEEVDPLLAGISRIPNGGLDPRPNPGSPALSDGATPTEAGVDVTAYRGAFARDNWAQGWTALDKYGYFGDLRVEGGEIVITDADLVDGESYNWSADNTYILDGNVYLEEGGVLTIEAGTVIKGRTVASNGIDISSSLIISRGAQIFAEGTAENPIIFTAEADDLSLTDDLTSTDNELWGGILILGRAPIGEDVPTGLDFAEDVIEGIPSEETRAFYGGTDAGDNSGVMRYVSIRHGGAILSGDNEIQGLSLGGVGNGTTLEYIEIFANLDDGIEIFGGTVNLKNVVVSFQGDDAIDVDESWDGFIQYALTLQQDIDPEIGDNAVEYDGSANEATDVEGTRTVGRIYNATFIGSGSEGSSNGLRMKEDGAAQFWNSIWTQFSGSVFRFQNTSVDRLDAGETVLANNIVWEYGQLYNDDGYSVEFEEVDPLLRSVSRIPDGGLDPRPGEGSPALEGAAQPTEEGVDVTDYRGAFGATNWALQWTALDEYGYFGETVGTVSFAQNQKGLELGDPVPNPVVGDLVNFSLDLPQTSVVAYSVYDLTGRQVFSSTPIDQPSGRSNIEISTLRYQPGTYFVLLRTKLGAVSQKFLVTQMR